MWRMLVESTTLWQRSVQVLSFRGMDLREGEVQDTNRWEIDGKAGGRAPQARDLAWPVGPSPIVLIRATVSGQHIGHRPSASFHHHQCQPSASTSTTHGPTPKAHPPKQKKRRIFISETDGNSFKRFQKRSCLSACGHADIGGRTKCEYVPCDSSVGHHTAYLRVSPVTDIVTRVFMFFWHFCRIRLDDVRLWMPAAACAVVEDSATFWKRVVGVDAGARVQSQVFPCEMKVG